MGSSGATARRTCRSSASTASRCPATRYRCTTPPLGGSGSRSATTCASPRQRGRSRSRERTSSRTRPRFPVAARIQTELITVARAAENRIYLLTANRVGKERGGRVLRLEPDRRPVRRQARRGRRDRGGAPRRRHRRRERTRQGLRHPRRVRALPLRRSPAGALRRARRGEAAGNDLERRRRWQPITSSSPRRFSKRTASRSPRAPGARTTRSAGSTGSRPRPTRPSSTISTAAHLFDLNVEYFIGMPSGSPPATRRTGSG